MTELDAVHQHARDRARNRDSKWFARRPFAYLRVREALPFEQILNGGSGRADNPFVLVCLTEDRTQAERIYFFADRMPAPDHASLTALRAALNALRERPAVEGKILASDDDLAFTKRMAAEIRQRLPDIHRLGMRA